jgi:hypothetical protein
MMDGFFLVAVFVVGIALGWVVANNTVATECKQLGGFYVGTTVYECNVKGETK